MRNKLLRILPAMAAAAAMAFGMAVSACTTPDGQTENLTDKPLEGQMLADFTEGEPTTVFKSDGWGNGSPFNTYWTGDNVSYENGIGKLTISQPEEPIKVPVYDEEGVQTGETVYEYEGGEMRTYAHYGYGDYEVRMKPAKKVGTTSTFFVCTGNYEAENPVYDDKGNLINGNPWDEIDIEFLGKETTHVQFNYFVNGEGGHEYMYDLGFDASEEFHNYGFRWAEDYITWFVDGEPVYRIDFEEDEPAPSTAGRILMNYWCGTETAYEWMGEYSNPGDEGAEYEWVKTTAQVEWTDANDPNLPDEPDVFDKFQGDWADYEAIEPSFTSSVEGLYTVENDGTSSRVTYTDLDIGEHGYANVSTDVTDVAADKNWVNLKLTNNGEETSRIRINVVNNEGASAVILNDYGYCGDYLLDKIDGNFAEVEPGETMDIVIKYKGTANSLELMIDSANTSGGPFSGDITISDIKFAKEGEIEDLPETPEAPEDLIINEQPVAVGGSITSNNGPYTAKVEDNALGVSYDSVLGNSYLNVELQSTAVASVNNTFKAKITNNGDAPVNIRINVQAEIATNEENNNYACNVSATMDGETVYTDTQWGGSMFDNIAAGATVEIVIVYDSAKQATNVQFMIDSHKGDSDTHSGNVTISEMAFSNDGTVPEEPSSSDLVINDKNVTVGGSITANNGPYTAKVEDNALNVSYDSVLGNSYINVELQTTEIASQNNTLTLKITNNGDAPVNIRINVQAAIPTNEENNNYACNVSATMDGSEVYTDVSWGGSMFDAIPAGATVEIVIVYDSAKQATNVQFMIDSHKGDEQTHSGNVTISEIVFSSSAAGSEE